jgi:Fe-S-cluster containining protein
MVPSDSDENSFVCRRCGACCRAAGDVRLRAGEVEAIAALLALDPYTFTSRYTRLAGDRSGLVLAEQTDGTCVFLNETNACRIQDAKPAQCRGYPQSWRHPVLDARCEGRRTNKEIGAYEYV